MPRLLSYLLLLLYAGVFLHCQPVPTRGATVKPAAQQQSALGLCKKKLQTVQANPRPGSAELAPGKLLPLDLALGSNLADLYFGLLYMAAPAPLGAACGPEVAIGQAFANHPNKAPPVPVS